MSLNTVCLRIFFVLFFVIFAVVIAFSFTRLVAPLAVCVLPSVETDGRFVSRMSLVEYTLNSNSVLIHTNIAYDSYIDEIVTTSSLPEGPFKVRYVRAFPSLVLRQTPSGSLGSYYADTWVPRQIPGLIFGILALCGVSYGAFRHFRNSRRGGYY